jgi:hypothetical protein
VPWWRIEEDARSQVLLGLQAVGADNQHGFVWSANQASAPGFHPRLYPFMPSAPQIKTRPLRLDQQTWQAAVRETGRPSKGRLWKMNQMRLSQGEAVAAD